MIFYSVHFNRPDFIEIQKSCIDFVGGKLVVINNSSDPRISEECQRLGIKMYEPEIKGSQSPSISHGNALNFLTTIIDLKEDWCIIDHDFFPVKKIDFVDYEILGLLQEREGAESYLWPGFMAGKKNVRLDKINFLPSYNKDTGAGTSSLLLGSYKIKTLSEEYLGLDKDNKDSSPLQAQKVIIKFEDFGVHYLNGSGWMKTEQKIEQGKNKFLLDIIDSMKKSTNKI
jgi:hypothetical protein